MEFLGRCFFFNVIHTALLGIHDIHVLWWDYPNNTMDIYGNHTVIPMFNPWISIQKGGIPPIFGARTRAGRRRDPSRRRSEQNKAPDPWPGLGQLPSGKQPHSYGNSPFLRGKSTISTGPFSIAMLNYQRVLDD